MPNILKKMQTDLYAGDMDAVEAATRKAIDEGMSPKEILDHGLIAGMDAVGRDLSPKCCCAPGQCTPGWKSCGRC